MTRFRWYLAALFWYFAMAAFNIAISLVVFNGAIPAPLCFVFALLEVFLVAIGVMLYHES